MTSDQFVIWMREWAEQGALPPLSMLQLVLTEVDTNNELDLRQQELELSGE
tara:strand:- start:574 stop:726 length:153 start_codon:yes stop_codon:yes gene_type:complete